MKKAWGYIVAAFSFVVALFFYERSKKNSAEEKLAHAEHDKEDSVLKERQSVQEKKEEDLKVQLKKQEETPAKVEDLTPEQVVDYWSKK
jgi:hypothetical protein